MENPATLPLRDLSPATVGAQAPRNVVIEGDCVAVMRELPAESVDAIVTDPPYGLEFMGKEWDRFATGRGAKYAKGGSLITEEQIAERRGKGGAGPSYINRPAKRCAKCGKQAWSGSPCKCDEPEWVMDNSPLHAAQAWHEAWAREAFRVAKPGAHLLAFGGTRTYHRLASAIEDAGWEIRDCLVWAYASGFPKSHNVAAAIDKANGHPNRGRAIPTASTYQASDTDKKNRLTSNPVPEYEPKSEESAPWAGWGTALKPSFEPIVMARKPLRGTVAANVQAFGTGALNIGATRIGTELVSTTNGRGFDGSFEGGRNDNGGDARAGRWPANLILTDPIFDGGVEGVVGGGTARGFAGRGPDAVAYRKSGVDRSPGNTVGFTPSGGEQGYGDSGTYSRFFLIPKASGKDRWAILRCDCADDRVLSMPEIRRCTESVKLPDGSRETRCLTCGSAAKIEGHPTVKPVALMRHLIRLVTPPGGLVLDPFGGSGTTAQACVDEGMDYLLIERDPDYVTISRARLGLDGPEEEAA